MHVVEHPGNDGAPVVLLVHGLTDSVASFAELVAELTPEHTVITYDRRGWGRSRDDEPPTSLADHAQDAIDLLAGRRATIVGHSYGGVVALKAATMRPDLVASLVVFEPTVPFTHWWPDHDEMMERSADMKPMLKRWSAGMPRRTPEQRVADEASMARDFSFVETAPFEFADVTVPCIVGGSVDTTPWDHESAQHLSELLDADVVMFRDAGHPAHRTHAREFAALTRRGVALGQPRA